MVTTKDSGGPRGFEVLKSLSSADQAQAKVRPETLREWRAGFRDVISLIALEPKWRPIDGRQINSSVINVTASNVISSHGLPACQDKLGDHPPPPWSRGPTYATQKLSQSSPHK